MTLYTCLTCRVAFADPERQRDHYKTDWHRYNLKRKVAEMPPVTAENFQEKVLARRMQVSEQEESVESCCRLCNKHFRSQNALENHIQSKKHKELEARAAVHGFSTKDIVSTTKQKSSEDAAVIKQESDGEDADSDADSWDGTEAIGLEECLFCSHVSSTLESNIEHMTVKHSFFLPDAEFISDLEGLIVYLGEKISQGHICLWCNERTKMFYNMKDVQKHMLDKGHCKMKHDDQVMWEYADFYDYRSSYPDADQTPDSGQGPAAEADVVEPEQLVTDGFELVLPSGSTIGHRSLARYYKQNLTPKRRETKSVLPRILAGYRALGWTGTAGPHMEKRAKDMQFLHRLKHKHSMLLGVKANKLQKHFRDQNS